jgi:hypothetical protein
MIQDLEKIVEESKKQLVSIEGSKTIQDTETGIYLELNRKNFVDESEEKKFIKNVERLVRSSLEYKEWIKFIKDTLNLNVCVFSGETDEETDDIEIHHHPLTLYDIVQAVCDTKIMKDQEFCTFDIAKEVIDLHFTLKVGFVPMLRSLHKKFHNGYLDIPIELVHGDYRYILDNYFIRDNVLEKVRKYESVTLGKQPLLSWSKDNYKFIQGNE